MSRQFHLRNVLVVAGSVAAVFALAALGAYAQGSRGPDALTPTAPGATLTTAISYQGRLLSGGAPVNSTCDLVFVLFDAASGGTQVGSNVTETLAVSGGLFTAPLDFGAGAFNGQARWLDTQVRCPAGSGAYTALLPRQPILPAPQALSLVPGALISGTLQNEFTVFASDAAVGNPFAVHGIAGGSANLFPIKPVGVYGESHTGNGMLAVSDNGVGLLAYSHAASGNAVYAVEDGGGTVIRADASTGNGVYATTNNSGGGVAALFGENTNGGYAVIGQSNNIAVYAANTGPSHTVAYLGSPCCAADLYGNVNVSGDLHIGGNLFATGSKAGYVSDFAVNAGAGALSAGDLVVVVGSAAPALGDIPAARAVKASVAYQSGVIGVVDRHVVRGSALQYDSGEIAPGEYFDVVTLGMFRTVKVDASFGAIHAGDLLVASPNPGYAMRAADRAQAVGAIVGKAMDDLPSGLGSMPILVTLQ